MCYLGGGGVNEHLLGSKLCLLWGCDDMVGGLFSTQPLAASVCLYSFRRCAMFCEACHGLNPALHVPLLPAAKQAIVASKKKSLSECLFFFFRFYRFVYDVGDPGKSHPKNCVLEQVFQQQALHNAPADSTAELAAGDPSCPTKPLATAIHCSYHREHYSLRTFVPTDASELVA